MNAPHPVTVPGAGHQYIKGGNVSVYQEIRDAAAAQLEADRAALEYAAGATLEMIDGGYRVKETGTHYIDVMQMIYNWRIVTTPKSFPLVWDRGWCYQGQGLAGLLPAVLAALAWDGSDDTEPAGYFKRAGA